MSSTDTDAHIQTILTEGSVAGEGSKGRSNNPGSRLYHKKSRTGCQRCRARRVKCNEVHPVCGNCQKHQLSCVYADPSSSKAPPRREPNANRETSLEPFTELGIRDAEAGNPDLPESRGRRLLELRLFHQFMTKSLPTIPGGTISDLPTLIPQLAFTNDALLYSLFSFSALHIARAEPQNAEAMETYSKYLDLTLQVHLQDIMKLSKTNADAVAMTSNILRMAEFAMLPERPLEPYTPPVQWLKLVRSTGRGMREVWSLIMGDDYSVFRILVRRNPIMVDTAELANFGTLFAESHRAGLNHLLRRTELDEQDEPWDAEIEEAYATTLSYVGATQTAVAARDAPADTCRRLLLFPVLTANRFHVLVEEQRPRALVILAYYFAVLAMFRDTWWIGDAGRREILAIQSVLPNQWQEFMSWPLQVMNEKLDFST